MTRAARSRAPGGAPTSGFAIHTRVHLIHPAAKVVLHLHAPYSTALTAIVGGRFEMVHQNSATVFRRHRL